MKETNLSEEIKKIDKRVPTLPKKVSSSVNSAEKLANELKPKSTLPQVRKVAIAKRRAKVVMLVALFISCFSLSIFVGFYVPFLLFK